MATLPPSSRHRIRPIGIVAAALIVVTGSYAASALGEAIGRRAGAVVAPSVPPQAAPAGEGAVGAGATVRDIDGNIRTWSAKAAADENDYISATNLGILYLGRARLTFDLDDYSRAAAATERALTAYPDYASARALDATVRFATHDFDGALAAARSLLVDAPGDADALAVIGDANLALGQIDAAQDAYARLASLTPGPALDVRLARLAYVTGDPLRALEIARRARAEALEAGVVDMAFFEYQLGEFARLAGDAATARSGYEAALSIRRSHLGALIGLARVDAAAGDPAVAIDRLEQAAAIVPQPEALALLGDLLAARGDEAGARGQFETVRLIAQLSELASAVYDRQLIAFELDHGGATAVLLDRARASLAARPDSSGHDLVAWALYRLGRFDEAAVEIEAARAYGADDARLRFHDGAIALARGDRTGGLTLIQSALGSGPALDPIERSEAEQLARE